ncbi:YkgJ family cysteine cluster protein [Chloroflexota bacterium]
MNKRDNRIYEPKEIDKLDLKKYGLTHLEGRNILTLDGTDIDRLLEALGNDDVSLNVPLPCTPQVIQELLSISECRRCGGCCVPNPLNPESPGVEVFRDELRSIAANLNTSYETMEKETSIGKVVSYPFDMTKLSITRWLPLPCPFHDAEPDNCRVYTERPVVCKIHPVIFTGDPESLAIKVNCDYGKEILIGAYKWVHEREPDLEILL